MSHHLLRPGVLEISGLPSYDGGVPRIITVHDGTAVFTSRPNGDVELRITARRCPGEVCMSIVDLDSPWARMRRNVARFLRLRQTTLPLRTKETG